MSKCAAAVMRGVTAAVSREPPQAQLSDPFSPQLSPLHSFARAIRSANGWNWKKILGVCGLILFFN